LQHISSPFPKVFPHLQLLKQGIRILSFAIQNLYDQGRESGMPNLIDSLHSPAVSEEFSDTGTESIERLFDIRDYKSGAQITQSENRQFENMGILAEGNIKVKVRSGVGESTIQILKPGDLVDASTINNSTALQSPAKLYAFGETRILSMGRDKFESLIESQAEMMCQVILGTKRSGSEILQSINHQFTELRNYIYGVNGLY